jgi:hypothetical protein
MDQASPGSPSSAIDGSVFLARTRALAPMLAGAADQIEERRELPASIVSALIENGLFRLLQPRFLGGVQLDPMGFCRGHRGSRQAGRQHCLVALPGKRLLDDRGLS